MTFVARLQRAILNFFDNRFTSSSQFSGDENLLEENYPIDSRQASRDITANLVYHSQSTAAESLTILDSNFNGLSLAQVKCKTELFGANQVQQQDKLTWNRHLWLSYKNPFNLLLTFLATVGVFTDNAKGTVVISIMILVSTVLRFVQERRSNNAADKLKSMVTTTATVIRQEEPEIQDKLVKKAPLTRNPNYSNSIFEIPIKDLVPGDIITLSAGDMIPADVRILTAKDFFVSQTSLTGESMPVEKFPQTNKEAKVIDALELTNIGFMGTNVISGTGVALVLTTGRSTLFGSLANKIVKQTSTDNSFQKGINKVSWLLIYFMLIMSPIVFLINGLTSSTWMDAALFAVAVAVGLTPEMLPMIVTATLAKGAVVMSRYKVIVKHLDAIQSFGAMNILCTDKTGTLTQDKICLERHIDIFGNEYDDVLEYAYLNSYYQTGLKNLLDVAVLEEANFGNIPQLVKRYHKVDEVPFDFKRRRMSVVVSDSDGEHVLICKGAVEEMLNCCSSVEYGGEIMPLTTDLLNKIHQVCAELNADGLRVVAVAKKNYSIPKDSYMVADEDDMILIGYVAFLDPPKETTRPAISALNNLGVVVKVLTGDNELVARKVCLDVGIEVGEILLGSDIDKLSDESLAQVAQGTAVFAKLTPNHKERIVKVLQNNGNVVGFLGDGINDAPALRAADIGISVDSAVDIAKEAAGIILLEKSLMVLEQGVREGRKTFVNMQNYIRMTASSNFGNVFAVLVASAFLPFLPMMPIHLLLQNLIYEISQLTIPFDNVDDELIAKPQNWDSQGLRRFMIFFGPISSIFDIITFSVLWYIFGANSPAHQTLFQSGWFLEGLLTQTLIVHMIRTKKIPFIQSTASLPMLLATFLAVIAGVMVPMTGLASYFGMHALPATYFIFLMLVIPSYLIVTQLLKNIYVRRFGW